MDGQRFDDFARQFARATSRRSVLKGLVGGVGGAVGMLVGNRLASAQSGCTELRGRCQDDGECCSGVCTVDARGRGRCDSCPDHDCPDNTYFDPRDCQCYCSYDRSICAPGESCVSPNGCTVVCPSGTKNCNGTCVDESACCPACASGAPCINEACCTSGVYDLNAGLCCTAAQKICNGECVAADTCCTDDDCLGNEHCGPQGCYCDSSTNALCGDTCCDTGDVCCDSGDGCVNNCCPAANLCHDVCVTDYTADPANCGQCDHACDTANGETCVQGQCRPPCDDTGQSCSTPDECCAASVCSDGLCCPSGLTNCDGTCVDTTSDPNNCSECGDTCYQPDNSQTTCVNSECGYVCDSGYTDCDYSCCSGDQTCCYGYCVDTQTDTGYCGNCDTECPEPNHATATCVDGGCGITCDTGYNVCGDFCCLSTHVCCSNVCCGEGAACDAGTGECSVQCGALQSACGDIDACCPSYYIDCGVNSEDESICCHNPGGTCSTDADCCVVNGDEVTCQDGICGSAGAYCEGDDACASDYCCYGTCCADNQTCTDNGCKLYEGETCSKDSECEYDLCCDNVCVYDQDNDNCLACGVVCDADEECYGTGGCLKQSGASCSDDSECYPGGKCLEGFCCSECGGDCGDAGSHPVADNTTCTYYDYPTNLDGICCSGNCLDPSGDSGNCGACGTTCPLGDSCHDGACSCTQPSPCGTTHYCREGGLCSQLADGSLACLYIDPNGCGDACTSNANCSNGQVCGTLGCCHMTCNYVE